MFKNGNFKIEIDKFFENFFLCSFFILTIVIFLYEYAHYLFLLRISLMGIGSMIAFYWCIKRTNFCIHPLGLSYFLLVSWLLCVFFQYPVNYPPKDVVYTLCYLWLAILLLKGNYSHIATVVIFTFGTATLIRNLLLMQGSSNLVLLATSRNYISVLVLMLLLFYCISCHDKNKEISFLPLLIFFITSVLAVGRGGILTSGFLLSALLFLRIKNIKNRRTRLLLYFFSAIVFFIVIVYMVGFDGNLFFTYASNIFSRFYEKGATDSSRLTIWGTFLANNMDSLREFIFGSDKSLVRSDGNLHNSFLQIYGNFGLFAFLIVMALIVKAYIQGLKNKDYIWLILYTTLLLRASTDTIFYQGYCEIFLYYFIFYWDYKRIVLK